MTWWLVQSCAWTLICAACVRGCSSYRFWVVLVAGYAFNAMGVDEGMTREKARHYRALHPIEAAPPAPQSN